MIKRMSFDFLTPNFIFLLTFLLSGCVIGAFSGAYVTKIDISGGILLTNTNIFLVSLIDALKYNLIIILICKYLGFLIPVLVFIRGYILTFSITAILHNSESFFENTVIFSSFFNNLVSIPCFLIISTLCIGIFINRLQLNNKNAKKKASLDNSYFAIILCVFINFIWCFLCQGLGFLAMKYFIIY